MRINDFIIDINDLWGRLVPGLVIILDIYLLSTAGFNEDSLLEFTSKHILLSTVLLIVLLLVARILGELSIHTIFHLPWISRRPPPRGDLDRMEVTVDNAVVKFFEEHFSTEALESNSSHLFLFCKDFLVETSPNAYPIARKLEAQINLQAGLLLPLTVLAGICFWLGVEMIAFLIMGLLVVNWLGWRGALSGERMFVYRAYYHWHFLNQQRPRNNPVNADH